MCQFFTFYILFLRNSIGLLTQISGAPSTRGNFSVIIFQSPGLSVLHVVANTGVLMCTPLRPESVCKLFRHICWKEGISRCARFGSAIFLSPRVLSDRCVNVSEQKNTLMTLTVLFACFSQTMCHPFSGYSTIALGVVCVGGKDECDVVFLGAAGLFRNNRWIWHRINVDIGHCALNHANSPFQCCMHWLQSSTLRTGLACFWTVAAPYPRNHVWELFFSCISVGSRVDHL